jgi:hypothetical protein
MWGWLEEFIWLGKEAFEEVKMSLVFRDLHTFLKIFSLKVKYTVYHL